MLSYRVLHQSPLLRVTDVRCRCARGAPGAEEHSAALSVAIARSGVFVRHIGREAVVGDANVASIFRPGVGFRVSHPCDGGDDCTSIRPSPGLLRELLAAIQPSAQERIPELNAGPCPPGAYLLQSSLVRLLRTRWPDPLGADELGVRLLGVLLGEAFEAARPTRVERGRETERAHRHLAARAKEHLASHASERLDLASLAGAVHASPFHLSRVFREQTGETLSRYLLRLRVRRAVSEVLDGERGLAGAAARAGFCDQSHFTNACRREFGLTPARITALGPHALRQMSKRIQEPAMASP